MSLYSALSITNLKSLIPITLDNNSSQYHSWVAQNSSTCSQCNVFDHIIPLTDEKELKAAKDARDMNPILWKLLDVTVFQWIYAIVSPEIFTFKLFLYALLNKHG